MLLFVLSKDNILELNIFAVNPRVSIIEFHHIYSPLGWYKCRAKLNWYFLLTDHILLYLNLTLEVSKVIDLYCDIMILDISFEVEQRVLIKDLNVKKSSLARTYIYTLINSQTIKRIHLPFRVSYYWALAITTQ